MPYSWSTPADLPQTFVTPGVIKEFRPSLSNLLGTLNVAGLGLGSLVSLALGGSRRFVSMDNGSAVVWRQLN